MTANYTNGSKTTPFSPKDICYQSMAPSNNNCEIFRVLNYFQNNNSTLNYKSEV
eukprot:m.313371 g.313371  ORF g.313371 m.313371 type:complete len:54 (+) comp379185_c0_seq1:366-527(+)